MSTRILLVDQDCAGSIPNMALELELGFRLSYTTIAGANSGINPLVTTTMVRLNLSNMLF